MAVWQFAVALLPQEWLDAGGVVETLYSKAGYSTRVAWAGRDFAPVKRRIGCILPLSESWKRSHFIWGSVEADDIHLVVEDKRVLGLSVRFDMLRPNLALFGHIAAAAADLQLAVLDVNAKRCVARDAGDLVQAAHKSRAALAARMYQWSFSDAWGATGTPDRPN